MHRRHFLRLGTLLLLASPASLVQAELAVDSPELAPLKAWMEQQFRIKSLVADFIQERHLKTVTKPLISTGKVWFDSAKGALRWQLGNPPKTLALRPAKGEALIIAKPEDKTAERYVPKPSKSGESDDNPLAFLDAGLSGSMSDFQEKFAVEKTEAQGSQVTVTMKLKESIASVAVMKLQFVVDMAVSAGLKEFRIFFRDGSSMITKMTSVTLGSSIPASVWQVPFDGYKIQDKK